MMSHINLAYSLKSLGCPTGGRCDAGGSGVSRRLALLSLWICCSVSRTEVKYSSILVRSGPLTLPRRSLAWERASSRMLPCSLLVWPPKRLSKASEGYNSIGIGEFVVRHEMCDA